jgi:hypothetical protein
MSEQKTFEEILSENHIRYTNLSVEQKFNSNDVVNKQRELFIKLQVLADYFNGENNWVPDITEAVYAYRIGRLLFPIPFRTDSALEAAIQILENEFPELIESFTKKK